MTYFEYRRGIPNLPPRLPVATRYQQLPEPDRAAYNKLVTTHRRTCSACPTQYEGTLTDGRTFYFRYRSGRAELGFGDGLDAAVEDSWVSPSIGYGDRLDGVADEDEFVALFLLLVAER